MPSQKNSTASRSLSPNAAEKSHKPAKLPGYKNGKSVRQTNYKKTRGQR